MLYLPIRRRLKLLKLASDYFGSLNKNNPQYHGLCHQWKSKR
nr:MAG TPA: hypothetical protein [Caudoviricetes sp.]